MQRERLKDGEENWGLTRIEFANLEKRRLREREKKRRQRARAMISIANAPPLVPEYQLGIFEVSGIKAYRSTHDGIAVSLPYVSILGGSHV